MLELQNQRQGNADKFYIAGCEDPSSPFVTFHFRVNSANPTTADIDLTLQQGTGTRYPLQNWFSASYTISGSELILDVIANTGETDLRMEGNTIARFGSDSPSFGYACWSGGCSGASGRWVQTMSASRVADVPEPASVLVLGMGRLQRCWQAADANRQQRKWPESTFPASIPPRACHRWTQPSSTSVCRRRQ
jgi:hypothetical protein